MPPDLLGFAVLIMINCQSIDWGQVIPKRKGSHPVTRDGLSALFRMLLSDFHYEEPDQDCLGGEQHEHKK